MSPTKSKYDVVIIGAGIGGLVCGSYLAKAGLRVLIIEKNPSVGGYCTSFRRGGFMFDSAVHSFGNFSETGAVNRIFRELSVDKYIRILRSSPSDVVRIKSFYMEVDNDPVKTMDSMIRCFPMEAQNIISFFDYVRNAKALDCFIELKGKTFIDFLQTRFYDRKIIELLSFPLGNIGLSAGMVAAFSAIMLYRDFIFDGGYYPEGGMQRLADVFSRIFSENGGELIKGVMVKTIIVKNGKTEGVICEEQTFICDCVISNCDANETFFNLIGEDKISRELVTKVRSASPSVSAYILYLGLRNDVGRFVKRCSTLWYFDDFSINDEYEAVRAGNLRIPPSYFLATFPSLHDRRLAPEGKSVMSLIVAAPFKTKDYWQSTRGEIADALIDKVDRVIPGIKEAIEIKTDATPHTLYRYTLNSRGAMCGWESSLEQVYTNRISAKTEIEGLYLTGHWATPPAGQGGIDVVIYSGRSTAKRVIAKLNRKKTAVMI